ncbi:hypothetical protein C7999DRAFT_29427 [Corynascus novoguineensis]|uniref:Uncharacterized protein n=1 Tax=Corynascus novoguineensis TaxID=1126955 RepID=A0AAN7D075_9PEZI|nr:hypothetical protein C7999DRAFT_29427 [Corynascus novoguineensis]
MCGSSVIAEHVGILLEPNGPSSAGTLNVASYPTVSGRFDNHTASLEIRGVYDGGYYKDARTSKSYIGGPVTISFLGSIDQDRSDELLSSSNDARVWNRTLGYCKTLFGQSAASPRIGLSTWLCAAGAISYTAWFMSWAELPV